MTDAKILLVEDENIEALDIKLTLESFGYEVPYVASSGDEAVEKALAIMPDLILMDIILKGDIDGIETVSKIKDLNIPVIYLTAHSEESTIERAKLTEPYGYILKPYDRTELKYAIELAIYKSKLKNELKDSETKYRTLFNQAADGILLMKGDKFIECNERALEIYGTNREQLIGKTPYSIFSPEIQPNGEISENRAVEYINNALDGYPQHFEWKHLKFDATPFYAEISLNRLKIKGQYLLQSIVRDITDRKHAENELKKSHNKEHLQAEIIHDASVSIGIGYPDGKLGFVNKAFEKLTGYSEEELKTINWNVELTPEKWRLTEQKCLDELQHSKKSVQYEKEYIKKDGSIVPIELIVNPHLDSKGNIDHYFSFITNITERKEAEEALQESETEYRDLFNHLNSGVAVYEASNNGKDFIFKDFNTAAENIEHVLKEDVIGKKLTEAFPGVKDFGIFEVFQKVWKTGNPEYFPENIYKDEKDPGSWRENWVYKLPNGKIVAIYNNITERKTAEKALKESEEKFRAIAENSIDAILIAVEKGKHVYVNPKAVELTGYSKEELLNTQIEDIAHTKEIVNLKKRYDQRIAGKHIPSTFETRIVRKDNQIVPIEISATKTTWEDQPAVMVQVRDITQRKKAEISLKKSEERFRAVAESATDAIVTTDENGKIIFFNNSLTKIFGYTKEEITGKPLTILMPNRYQKNYLIALQNFKDSGKHRLIGKTVTTIGLKKDKSEFPFEMSLSTWKSKQKTYFTSIIRDLSERQKAEKALKESETYYRTMFENTGTATIIIDKDMTISQVNTQAGKLSGYSKNEIEGQKKWTDFIVKEELNRLKEYYALRNGPEIPPREYETRFIDKHGNIKNIHVTIATIPGTQKELASILDITKNKKVENALKESKKKYKTLFESNPNYTILVGWNGVILDFNVAAEQIIGISKEELVGKHFMELGIFPEDELDLLEKKFSHLLKYENVTPFETRIIDKNREIRHGETSLTLIKKDNIPANILVIFNDITERKKAEKELLESEGLLRGLFDNMPSGMSVYQVQNDGTDGSDYIIKEFNVASQKIEGMKREDIIGKSLKDIRPEIDEYGLIPIFKEVWETGKPIQYPAKIYVDEKYANYYENYVFKAPTGEIVAIYEDVTKQEKAKENIQKSLEEKEILLREVNHRVKNNLQIVASLLHLQEVNVNQKELVDILKESETRVNTMATVHEKLYQSANFADINFKQYIEKLVYDLLYTYGIKVGTIDVQLDIEDINLNIDTAIPLGLILNEIITNSIKYAFPQNEGNISIKLKSLPENMELTIADDGTGMPKNFDIENIKTLGIQLVKNLINQLDGTLKLNTDKGTEFKITFKELKYKERI